MRGSDVPQSGRAEKTEAEAADTDETCAPDVHAVWVLAAARSAQASSAFGDAQQCQDTPREGQGRGLGEPTGGGDTRLVVKYASGLERSRRHGALWARAVTAEWLWSPPASVEAAALAHIWTLPHAARLLRGEHVALVMPACRPPLQSRTKNAAGASRGQSESDGRGGQEGDFPPDACPRASGDSRWGGLEHEYPHASDEAEEDSCRADAAWRDGRLDVGWPNACFPSVRSAACAWERAGGAPGGALLGWSLAHYQLQHFLLSAQHARASAPEGAPLCSALCLPGCGCVPVAIVCTCRCTDTDVRTMQSQVPCWIWRWSSRMIQRCIPRRRTRPLLPHTRRGRLFLYI